MGTFTDQVQCIASEQRETRTQKEIKQQQKEQREKEKREIEEIKEEIYFYFLRTLEDSEKPKETALKLARQDKKRKIISFYINKEEQYFTIDLLYNNLLNKAKQGFIPYDNYKQKQEAEQIKKKQKELLQIQFWQQVERNNKKIFEREKERKKKNKIFWKIIEKLE